MRQKEYYFGQHPQILTNATCPQVIDYNLNILKKNEESQNDTFELFLVTAYSFFLYKNFRKGFELNPIQGQGT